MELWHFYRVKGRLETDEWEGKGKRKQLFL